MATVIKMPKMSDTMTEGVLLKWLKKVGSTVAPGDILAEVETDKATMELEAYEEGTLLYCIEAGRTVAVDAVIAVIGEQGEAYEPLLNSTTEVPTPPAAEEKKHTPQVAQDDATHAVPTVKPKTSQEPTSPVKDTSGGRLRISPLARSLAKEAGYDPKHIQGTGPNGRVIKRDVERFTPREPLVGKEGYTTIPFSQMRSTIARRLVESKFTAPHFYVSMSIRMDAAITARERINDTSPVRISFNDMVVKACAIALTKHPAVNSGLSGECIREYHHVHIGVAVAVPDGLLVPVVRFANTKTLSAISSEVKDFAERAKNKTLKPQDWEGSTFTISNLGMYGVASFTAIINPPNTCILAVGGIKKIVEESQAGIFSSASTMEVTLSCDHRAVDGAMGAAFLNTIKDLLEEPVRMLT